jgi:hypothetical protein
MARADRSLACCNQRCALTGGLRKTGQTAPLTQAVSHCEARTMFKGEETWRRGATALDGNPCDDDHSSHY